MKLRTQVWLELGVKKAQIASAEGVKVPDLAR